MYPRLIQPPPRQSFFLFGPRGVGKTAWLHRQFPGALFFDMLDHPKFYYFDAGVFQAVRPRGPLDAPEEIHGAALETLFLQQARALNDYKGLGYRLHYWRTATGDEVDFVLYGERGLSAFEVKMAHNVRPDDLRALLRWRADFPQAKAHLLYLGQRRWHERGIEVLPFLDCVTKLDQWL